MYSFRFVNLNSIVLGILLSLTLGMLLFIVIDELYPRIKNTSQKKVTYSGVLLGIILLVISMIIG